MVKKVVSVPQTKKRDCLREWTPGSGESADGALILNQTGQLVLQFFIFRYELSNC